MKNIDGRKRKPKKREMKQSKREGEQLFAFFYFFFTSPLYCAKASGRAGKIDKNKRESLCNITIAFLLILVYNKYIKRKR